jgi:acyl-CoA thioesterase I
MKYFVTVFFTWVMLIMPPASAEPLRVVAFGDSLTAGYGLAPEQAFPAQLETALRQKGIDVVVENAGVSGETTADALLRVNTVIAGEKKPDLVILEFGANDMLRNIPAKTMEDNLRQILTILKQQKIPVLLAGMKAPMRYFMLYRRLANKSFDTLADEFDVPMYDFFLEGVILKPQYSLHDGIHPNADGIAVIVKNILPDVKKIIAPAKGIMGWFE